MLAEILFPNPIFAMVFGFRIVSWALEAMRKHAYSAQTLNFMCLTISNG